MMEFFSEKMQVPIEPFNPFENVAISTRVDQTALAKSAHALGEVVGLALRNLGETPIAVNLRPPSVIRSRDLDKRKPFLLAAAVCLILAIAPWGLFFDRAATIQDDVIAGIDADANRLDELAKQFERLAAEHREREARAEPLLLAVAEREAWVRIMNDLATNLPRDFIWVTQITPLADGAPVSPSGQIAGAGRAAQRQQEEESAPRRPGGRNAAPAPAETKPAITALEIQGLYLDNPKQATVIDDFVNNLQKSKVFDIKEGDKARVVTKRSTPDEESWAYAYTIVVPLANPIALP